MGKVNAISIYLRERLWHPLVGQLDARGELDAPLSCAQGEILADVIEEMWECLTEEKQQEISAKVRAKGFNNLCPEAKITAHRPGRW